MCQRAQQKHELKGHTSSVLSVSFSPDGQTLASGGSGHDNLDHTIRLWDVSTGKLKQTLEGHTSGVESVSFSPDGQTLASGCDDTTIRLWDVSTGKQKHTFRTYPAGVAGVSSVSFSH